MKTGYYLDFSEHKAKLKRLTDVDFPNYIEKGLYNAINELLEDSKTKPPQCPRDIGDLHAATAGTVQVKRTRNDISVVGGFNKIYAKRHHEVAPGTYKYTTTKGVTQPGPKFMQSKMAMYAKKYIGIVAETIRRKGR